jgi:acyl-CoA synthetase (AMP-forming)/AMP-acid ligase II
VGTIAVHAERDPNRVAVIYGNGDFVETWGELEQRSRRWAHLLRARGLGVGGCVAAIVANDDPVFMDLFWACHRIGVYITPVNWHLQESEIQYIVDDCDADALVVSPRFAEAAVRIARSCPKAQVRIVTAGTAPPGSNRCPTRSPTFPWMRPLADQREGSIMLYSSGTHGRPKGVRRALPDEPPGGPVSAGSRSGFMGLFGLAGDERYLVPAPLYHAAPLAWSTNLMRNGSSVVILPRFDPELALQTIQDQRVTASQWVPTHFRRLLQLPASVRATLRPLVAALRGARGGAVSDPVKKQMIEWWGDAICEYYGGTEGGGTVVHAREWLERPGTVGRHWGGGKVWVLDEDGQRGRTERRGRDLLPDARRMTPLLVSQGSDEDREHLSRRSLHDRRHRLPRRGGFLFLTDRQSNMIISGGVNIYPQETENHLIVHPKVDDVAVIGVPNEEMGEEVKAVVIPARASGRDPSSRDELIAWCRSGIAHYKCPRTIDFVTELPRTETGKMAKRVLRDPLLGEGRRAARGVGRGGRATVRGAARTTT